MWSFLSSGPCLGLGVLLESDQVGEPAQLHGEVLDDVVEGDHADEAAVRAHDRRSTYSVSPHFTQGKLEAGVLAHGEHLARHDVADGDRAWFDALRDHSDDDVAICQDADRY